MALAVWQATITDAEGNAVAGASVRVDLYTGEATTTLATIKPARDGSGTLGNPFAADADGFARFFAAVGRYKITVTYAGAQRVFEHQVLLVDAELPPAAGDTLVATPASGTTENYTPSGWTADVRTLILEPGAGAAVIGGLPPGVDGDEVTVICNHANGITLDAESAGSTAAWRFFGSYDLGLPNKAAARIKYNSVLTRWVLLP